MLAFFFNYHTNYYREKCIVSYTLDIWHYGLIFNIPIEKKIYVLNYKKKRLRKEKSVFFFYLLNSCNVLYQRVFLGRGFKKTILNLLVSHSTKNLNVNAHLSRHGKHDLNFLLMKSTTHKLLFFFNFKIIIIIKIINLLNVF